MNYQITLMMVTFDRKHLTIKTINNIYETAGYPFTLVVVDNGSKDGSVEYLKELQQSKNIILVLNNENKGIAVGRNQALFEADKLNTDIYCTVDNDIEPPKLWLKECVELLQDNPGYIFGVNYEDTTYPIVTVKGKQFQLKKEGNLGTATFCFSKKIHKLLGFFNTEFIGYAHEDADFCMRARILGLKLGYLKEKGIHLGSGNNDVGPYREFKTKTFNNSLPLFQQNAAKYFRKEKPLYIPFKGE
jgi:GT2 family glycosyltransferase